MRERSSPPSFVEVDARMALSCGIPRCGPPPKFLPYGLLARDVTRARGIALAGQPGTLLGGAPQRILAQIGACASSGIPDLFEVSWVKTRSTDGMTNASVRGQLDLLLAPARRLVLV